MNDPLLINFLIFGIGALTGYIIGIIRAGSLERGIMHCVYKGEEVFIFIGKEGHSYKLSGNKVKVTKVMLSEVGSADVDPD